MDGLIYLGKQMYASKSQVQAILDPSSTPIKNYIKTSEQKGRLIRVNRGRKPKALVVTANGTLYLSNVTITTLRKQMLSNGDAIDETTSE